MLKYLNSRIARLLLAAVIAVCLTSVAATRVLYQTSIEAVLNAPRIEIEAPTDGVLGAFAVEPGRTVKTGALLVSLRRDEFSRGTTDELGARLKSLRDRSATLDTQMTSLRALRDSLHLRVKAYRTATIAQLTAASASATSRAVERAQNLSRAIELRSANGTTQVDVDRARSESAVADAESASARAALAAAERGVVTGQGAQDVPYSQQRIDELSVQLTNLAAEASLVQIELESLQRTSASDAAVSQIDGSIDVRATVDGVVWSARQSVGAHVTKGSTLVTLIDCSRLYLDATISPRHQDQIQPGAEVRLRFAGTSHEFPGNVSYVRGGGVRDDGEAAAQLTLSNRRNDSHAIIEVKPEVVGASPGNFCQVGRSAKVIFSGPDVAEQITFSGLKASLRKLATR